MLQPKEDHLVLRGGEVGEAEGQRRTPRKQRDRVHHHERRLRWDHTRQEVQHLMFDPRETPRRTHESRCGELIVGHVKSFGDTQDALHLTRQDLSVPR